MSVPYNYPLGWTHWELARNATLKTYMEEIQEKTADDNRIFFFFY